VLRLPFPVAAKTGTSKGYSDNWAFGFTRERTVAVWAGNFDGTPMIQVSGVTGAGPIFKRVMLRSMDGVRPAALIHVNAFEQARICPLSGELAGPWCPGAMEEVFAAGTRPKHQCSMHRGLAKDLPEPLAEHCQALTGPEKQVVDVGMEFYDWARTEGVFGEPWLASACAEANSLAQAPPPRILSPSNGDEFLLLPDLPLDDQSIPLRVRAAPSQGPLEVRLDGQALFLLEPPFSGRLPATRGEHVLSLHRPQELKGVAQVRFRVRQEQREYWAR
jgi:penicillin-binding protein 1C